ncbi:MAG TPA: DUF1801 domain-containing protein [Phycisphaerales bacterium]|nr:DUF1801 domain-containing protein [Phycisphaerales bacterium]
MQSKAATVKQYIEQLPPDRREAVSAVRDVILKNLDKGYAEGMSYGMIGYCVPHSIFPAGYHCDPKMPLPFAGLASQKGHMSLYLMGVYCGCDGGAESALLKWFRDAWAKSGKKRLDMGKSCIRFKSVEDLPLDVIGEAIRRMPVKSFVAEYERSLAAAAGDKAKRSAARSKPPAKTKAAAKPAAKKVTAKAKR